MTAEPLQLMSASEVDRTIVRLAHEVLERNNDLTQLTFVGIRRRGVPLAERLARKIGELERLVVPVGHLDITLYRDDLTQVGDQPVLNQPEVGVEIVGRNVVLVDDVLYTGRTIRAALDALFSLGRPARVQLLALIDRGHRELPIEAGYVGRRVTTTSRQIVEVKFQEVDGAEKVMLVTRPDSTSS
ncbi:MAG: bifunctional pyr operon transcriptional regulator/uracil phosphoribosyltransferase PyrR [Bryobacterales bacterium]|jgi:pyrimidine operon attenuation protein/uracil phosphoribosyltransferase|nr:bifunctional pyr operon transcriptional regulator/uracil phosphoribosyltransferase PyrR [Bryobacterales bacterium]